MAGESERDPAVNRELTILSDGDNGTSAPRFISHPLRGKWEGVVGLDGCSITDLDIASDHCGTL